MTWRSSPSTAAGRGASLSYVAAWRLLECGLGLVSPPGEFDEWNEGLAIAATGTDSGGVASQRSVFREDSIHVVSRIAGDASRGTSFLQVTFSLDETTACSLTGTLSLLGSDGVSCVSLVDLAHQEWALINEIIIAPPGQSEVRPLSFALVLAPGTYMLEAMLYGGGDHAATSGGIDLVFSIPEPAALLPAAGAVLLFRRQRRGVRTQPAASKTVSCRSPGSAHQCARHPIP